MRVGAAWVVKKRCGCPQAKVLDAVEMQVCVTGCVDGVGMGV